MTPKGLAVIGIGLFVLDLSISAGGNNGGAVGLVAIALWIIALVWGFVRGYKGLTSDVEGQAPLEGRKP
jgi:hypothetical protein